MLKMFKFFISHHHRCQLLARFAFGSLLETISTSSNPEEDLTLRRPLPFHPE
ncbi:hypothetical protein CVT24_011177 [Panaeolus cyanescens]|uniref:Uncharacterized protein n=1 Tax=Panaeolus cyanescens TaxID=181874 RepID=A0A409YGC9_9AGAR|nr:hypothetical protein CVT24_011177 [Panaeolus cyanescens]